MPCREQTRLFNVYRAKVAAYSTCVNDLTLMCGKVTVQEYVRLLAAADRARTASEVARLALDRHMEEHDYLITGFATRARTMPPSSSDSGIV
jgi:hypothetical protein